MGLTKTTSTCIWASTVNETAELDSTLETALHRAAQFEQALVACFGAQYPMSPEIDTRSELCFAALLLSQEHAGVLKQALCDQAPSTAAALLRLQFEALVRAAWILYAADDHHIEALAQPISEVSELATQRLPMPAKMLDALRPHAPAGLVQPLCLVNDEIRHPLNSYVHSGLHPIRRRLAGFPIDLQLLILRHSNDLLHHVFRVLGVVHRSQALTDVVTAVHLRFPDCVTYGSANPSPSESAARRSS